MTHDQLDSFPEPWPAYDLERLANVVATLAARVEEPEVRAQLHALSAVIRNLDHDELTDGVERVRSAQELAGALENADEEAVTAALRRLTAVNRAAVRPVDWTASSGG